MRRSLGALVLIPIVMAGGCGGGGGDGTWVTPSPEPPVAPAELVAIGGGPDAIDAFDGVQPLDPRRASLVGPHRIIRFGAVVTTTTITPEQAAANSFDPVSEEGVRGLGEAGVRATDGYEFLVLGVEDPVLDPGETTITYTGCTGGTLDEPEAEVTATIRAGEREVDLDPAIGGQGSAGTTLLVSVPTGADVTLALEDEGRTQSLDLRTGERGDDAIALYYPRRTGSLGDQIEALGQVGVPGGDGEIVPISGEGVDAGLLPYYHGVGWAERGRAWLCVTVALVTQTGETDITVDAAASFGLATPGGTRAPRPGELTVASLFTWQGEATGTLLFDVSDDFESGNLTFSPHGTVAGDGFGPVVASDPMPVELEG